MTDNHTAADSLSAPTQPVVPEGGLAPAVDPAVYKERASYPIISTLERGMLEKVAVELAASYADVHQRWLDAEAANSTFVEQSAQLVQMNEDLTAANNTGRALQEQLDAMHKYVGGLEKLVAAATDGAVAVAPAGETDSIGLPKVPGL